MMVTIILIEGGIMTLGKIIKSTVKSKHMLECTKEILKGVCGACGTSTMLAREKNKVYC